MAVAYVLLIFPIYEGRLDAVPTACHLCASHSNSIVGRVKVKKQLQR
jgi:hypothetical protein